MPVQGSVHNVQRAPHQTLGTRTRRRGRADAARSEPASHACAPRNRRASVRHAEDADGCDTLSNQAVAQCRDRNGAERTRLQPHTRSKHRRHQAAPGGNPGLKSSCRHAHRVSVQVARRGPRLTPDPIQKKYAQTVVSTRIVSGYVQFFGEGKTFLHSLGQKRRFDIRPITSDLPQTPDIRCTAPTDVMCYNRRRTADRMIRVLQVSGTKSYSPTPCSTRNTADVSPALVTRCGRFGGTEKV